MFLPNKYTAWYYAIVTNKNNRKKKEGTYYEKHHIIPESLGGSNAKTNLVLLTAREHFICHVLLTKMLKDQMKIKMEYALFRIAIRTPHKMTSRVYTALREAHAKNVSAKHKGKIVSEATRQKISVGNKGKIITEEQRLAISKRFKGKVFTQEHKDKIGKAHKGKIGWNRGIPMSDENKKALSLANSGTSHYLYGKTPSIVTRAKLSEAGKGRAMSDKNKKILKEINTGKEHSQETKEKIAKSLIGRKRTPESIAKQFETRKLNRLKELNPLSLL